MQIYINNSSAFLLNKLKKYCTPLIIITSFLFAQSSVSDFKVTQKNNQVNIKYKLNKYQGIRYYCMDSPRLFITVSMGNPCEQC